ncbi:MAG: CbiX/SirB N-terminal domain-containing protein [Planctomycetota bacterium]
MSHDDDLHHGHGHDHGHDHHHHDEPFHDDSPAEVPDHTPLADLPTEAVDLDSTGMVIVDHGSRRQASNAMLERFVEQLEGTGRYPIVEAAHMELAEPSIATAFDRCVQRGANKVLICPYFLLPGKHWNQDIPALAAEAAGRHPGVSFVVTAPIGLHPMMQQVIASRIDHCLAHIAGQADECESCAGTGRCSLNAAGVPAEAGAQAASG